VAGELTSLPSQALRLFTLGQRVEVFDGSRWFLAEVLAIVITETGLHYAFEGRGFGGCLRHTTVRAATAGDSPRRIAISVAGIDYKSTLPRWLSWGTANSNAMAVEP
jgi:hypothetical protein